MKIKILISVLFIANALQAQKYFTRNGVLSFTSSSPLEKIEAITKSANSVIDIQTGQLEFAVLLKSFRFEKALMEEHFNENYVESDKYPKAVFKGSITNLKALTLTKDGEYKVNVKGELILHGITKPLETNGIIIVLGGKWTTHAKFSIKVADYNISIPALVKDNIAKIVDINLKADFEELKKNK